MESGLSRQVSTVESDMVPEASADRCLLVESCGVPEALADRCLLVESGGVREDWVSADRCSTGRKWYDA